MSEVKWIKIVTDIFDNRKIRQIEIMPDGDTVLVIWFKLICLAGRVNDNGLVYVTEDIPYTEEMLAAQFNRPISTVRFALNIFEKFGMIEVINDFLCLPSWEKYQSADKLEKMKSKNAERQARFRAKKRAELEGVTLPVTLPVTPSNAIDIDRDIDRDSSSNEEESEGADAPTPTRRRKSEKHKYGQYGWVLLTDDQYTKLVADLGQAEVDRCIAYVDESAQGNGNKNGWKDWNLVVRRCHREGWGMRYGQRGGQATHTQPRNDDLDFIPN